MDKAKIFTIAAIWMVVVVIIYTNLTPVPFALIIIMNILMMIGIMSRIVPAMALVSALPKMQDRGAFMSINSSLQQIAGGVAAGIGGLIVVQKTKTSPLQHYDTLGYVIVFIILANIISVYRVRTWLKQDKISIKCNCDLIHLILPFLRFFVHLLLAIVLKTEKVNKKISNKKPVSLQKKFYFVSLNYLKFKRVTSHCQVCLRMK